MRPPLCSRAAAVSLLSTAGVLINSCCPARGCGKVNDLPCVPSSIKSGQCCPKTGKDVLPESAAACWLLLRLCMLLCRETYAG